MHLGAFMIECFGLISIVFFDAMYDDIELSRSACDASRRRDVSAQRSGGRCSLRMRSRQSAHGSAGDEMSTAPWNTLARRPSPSPGPLSIRSMAREA